MVVFIEEIFLERMRLVGVKVEFEKGVDFVFFGNVFFIVCRICGKKGDYWIFKCFFKELVVLRGIIVGGEKLLIDDNVFGIFVGVGGKGLYVLFSMCYGKGNEGESMK